MTMLNKLRLRLRALFIKSKMEEELDEEVRFHLEREIEENIIRGMTPEEARYAAIRSFGGVERVKEESRDVRGIRLLEELRQDLRYGARMLLKHPGFTLVAVITLALGIGANTAIFSLVNAVLLRPLPFPEAGRLVQVWNTNLEKGITSFAITVRDYTNWRRRSQAFEHLAAYRFWTFTLTGGGEPEQLPGNNVSASFFSTLGVNPLLGRTFLPAEEQPGGAPVVALSHGLWQRRFGGDPGIINQTVMLDGKAY